MWDSPMRKKNDPFKEIRESLTPMQLSFFLGLNLDRNKLISVKSIGQQYFTADVYTYKVLNKLVKMGLIEVEKGKKELIVNNTTLGNEFIKSGNFNITFKDSST